jgi:hypothetical protein
MSPNTASKAVSQPGQSRTDSSGRRLPPVSPLRVGTVVARMGPRAAPGAQDPACAASGRSDDSLAAFHSAEPGAGRRARGLVGPSPKTWPAGRRPPPFPDEAMFNLLDGDDGSSAGCVGRFNRHKVRQDWPVGGERNPWMNKEVCHDGDPGKRPNGSLCCVR